MIKQVYLLTLSLRTYRLHAATRMHCLISNYWNAYRVKILCISQCCVSGPSMKYGVSWPVRCINAGYWVSRSPSLGSHSRQERPWYKSFSVGLKMGSHRLIWQVHSCIERPCLDNSYRPESTSHSEYLKSSIYGTRWPHYLLFRHSLFLVGIWKPHVQVSRKIFGRRHRGGPTFSTIYPKSTIVYGQIIPRRSWRGVMNHTQTAGVSCSLQNAPFRVFSHMSSH